MRWWRVVPVAILVAVGVLSMVLVGKGTPEPPAWLWGCLIVGTALFLIEIFVDVREIRRRR